MASVDDRVVNMQFNNREFEKNTSTTMGSLGKLKKSLDFSGSKKSLGELKDSTSKFNLNSMADAVAGVGKGFTAMSAVAFTVIQNLTNRAVDAGLRIVKAFSIGSMMDGFHEYETTLNSIQTVLANTQSEGTTLDNVNDALQQLNTYSDQTIYNFSEMARNIGTFTAAGVNLDTSVASIKGIANLAAIAGSNSQQASTAMYQLSQAIASGSVKLMDWNSVVNAGMGGKVFQKALFDSGKAMGTLTDVPMTQTFDQWTDAGNTFRDSLKSGWITSEVLTNTLEGFTGDLTDAQLKAKGYNAEQIKQIQEMGKMGKEAATKVKSLTQLIGTAKEAVGSGWTQTWQIIFGDFDEAKTLFTSISNVLGDFIGKSADARNQVLGDWKKMGGRTVLIDGIKRAFQALIAVVKPIKDAFREIFPKKTGEDLFNITSAFRAFTKSLMPSADTVDKLKRSFKGLFAFIQTIKSVLFALGGVIGEFFKNLDFGNGSILDITASIGDWLVKLNDAVTNGGALISIMQTMNRGAKAAAHGLSEFAKFLGSLFSGWNKPDASGVTSFFGTLRDKMSGLSGIGDRFKRMFQKIGEFLKPIIDQLKSSFSGLWTAIKDSFSQGNFNSVLDIFNTGFLALLVLAIKKFLSGGMNLDFGGGLLEEITKSFSGLTGVLSAMQTNIKANAILKIAGAIALLSASMIALSMIDSDKLQSAMIAMAVGFGQLLTAMGILTKISGSAGFAKMPVITVSMVLLAGAIALLTVAVHSLASLSWQELAKGMSGVAALLGMISVAVIPLSKNSSGMISVGIGLTAVAIALNLMYFAVKNFSSLNWSDMAKGMAGVAGSLVAIAGGMKLMPRGMIAQSAALVAIAGALNLMYLAVKNFSSLNWLDMAKGLAGVAGSLGAIALGMKLMPKGILLQAVALNAVGSALLIIGKAMDNMSNMS